MRILYVIMIIICLSGCCCNPVKPEQPVIKETKYVIKVPPAETMKLPEPVKNIDVDKSTQAEVADWLINKDAYTTALENKLIEIAKFFSDNQKELDTKK